MQKNQTTSRCTAPSVQDKGHVQSHKPESVLFVPFTPGGELRKELQQIDRKVTSTKNGQIRVVERLGNTLIQSLGNQAPWRGESCGRSECWPCRSKPGSCRKHNINYSITCMTCHEEGKKQIYWGESHRSGWDRALDHQKALKVKDESYAIVKHAINAHCNTNPKFQFKVESKHRSSFERQVKEAINIDATPSHELMNSKSEWGRNPIPRIVVQDDLSQSQAPANDQRQPPDPTRSQGNKHQAEKPGQDISHAEFQQIQNGPADLLGVDSDEYREKDGVPFQCVRVKRHRANEPLQHHPLLPVGGDEKGENEGVSYCQARKNIREKLEAFRFEPGTQGGTQI